jgi:uridine phosphorylase
LKYPYHVGVVQSKDSFYGQHESERMPVGYELENKWGAWKKCGCLASEMETAAIFTVSGILRIKAGCVLMAVWNQEREKAGLDNPTVFNTTAAIKTAVEAVKICIQNQ